ncbi:MAG: thiamine phosphate synthase [Gemmatimonadota bacterium]
MGDRVVPWLIAAVDETRLGRDDFPARLEGLLAAGCPAVLLRGGGLSARRLWEIAEAAAGRCRAHGAELWIGDRADIARACGADAVQLPARGLSTGGARRVVGAAVRVGRSVHSAVEAETAAASGADHLIVGTVLATPTHPTVDPAGIELLAAVAAATTVPFLAIGGITPDTAAAVAAAGARGVVAVRALWDAPDAAAAVAAFRVAFRSASGRGRADALHSPP